MSLRDDLRTLANRPLDSSQRGLLVGSLLVPVVIVGLVLLFGPGDAAKPRDRARPPAASSDTAPVTAPPPEQDTAALPNEEDQLEPERQPRRADVDAARTASRRALRDYLAYTYGRRSARRVRGISDTLRAQLERDTPRVRAADVRGRRPTLASVTTESVTTDDAQVLALVDDGDSRYSVRADLERDDQGWVVTGIDRA